MHSNTLYFFECEEGFVADNGQNDVTNGSVENYPPDPDEDAEAPAADGGETTEPEQSTDTTDNGSESNEA